jgi:hypothetical protein
MFDIDNFVFNDNTKWLVKTTGQNGANNGVVISQCKTELNGHCGLVYAIGGNGYVTYRDCNLFSSSANVTILSSIGCNNIVNIDGCTLPYIGNFHIGNSGNSYDKPATLLISNSSFSQTMSKVVRNSSNVNVTILNENIILDNAKAVIAVNNCNSSVSASTGNTFWYVVDFNYQDKSESYIASNIAKKTKFVKIHGLNNMDMGGIQQSTLWIPRLSTILGVNIHHIGGNAVSGDLYWQIIGIKINSTNDEIEEVIATTNTYSNADTVHEHLLFYAEPGKYHKIRIKQNKQANIGGTLYADIEYY